MQFLLALGRLAPVGPVLLMEQSRAIGSTLRLAVLQYYRNQRFGRFVSMFLRSLLSAMCLFVHLFFIFFSTATYFSPGFLGFWHLTEGAFEVAQMSHSVPSPASPPNSHQSPAAHPATPLPPLSVATQSLTSTARVEEEGLHFNLENSHLLFLKLNSALQHWGRDFWSPCTSSHSGSSVFALLKI